MAILLEAQVALGAKDLRFEVMALCGSIHILNYFITILHS